MRRSLAFLLLLVLTSGCALIPPTHPDLAYYPSPRDPGTIKISQTLHRAAEADAPTSRAITATEATMRLMGTPSFAR